MVYRSCVGIVVNTRIVCSKTNFFFLVFFYRRGGYSRAIIYTSPAHRKTTCYGTRAFFLPRFPLLFLLLFIFYTAFIKNLLNIDFALVSPPPPPPAIWPQPGGGSRGGNCFVRRSNKNYKTFICTCKGIIHDNDNNI